MKMESSKGIQAEIHLDFDKVCAYEKEHPDWSLLKELKDFGDTLRFTTLDLLASFVYEGGWKAWVRDGFTMDNLAEALTNGLEELGFYSEAVLSRE